MYKFHETYLTILIDPNVKDITKGDKAIDGDEGKKVRDLWVLRESRDPIREMKEKTETTQTRVREERE